MFLHTVCLDKYVEAIFRSFKDIKTVDILDIKTFDILKSDDLLGSLSCLTFHFVLPMFECWMLSGSPEWVVGGARRRLGGKKLARKTSPATWSSTAHCTLEGWSAARLVSAHQQTSSGVQLTSMLADQLANLNPASFRLERRHCSSHYVAACSGSKIEYTLSLSVSYLYNWPD